MIEFCILILFAFIILVPALFAFFVSEKEQKYIYSVELFGYDTYMLAQCEEPTIHAEIKKRSQFANKEYAETVYVVDEPDFFHAVALINNWFKSNNVNTEDVEYPDCCRYIKDYIKE